MLAAELCLVLLREPSFPRFDGEGRRYYTAKLDRFEIAARRGIQSLLEARK